MPLPIGKQEHIKDGGFAIIKDRLKLLDGE